VGGDPLGGLGTIRVIVPLSAERRRLRYARRGVAGGLIDDGRLAGCGKRLVAEGVAVKVKDSVGHYSGVATCGLVWRCPVCGPKIRHHRASEITEALENSERHGFGVVFLTLTASHTAQDSLYDLYSRQEAAWASMKSGRHWGVLRSRLGVLAMITFREITWGSSSGWHPHRHVAIITYRPWGEGRLGRWEREVATLWSGHLARHGLRASVEYGARAVAVRQGGGAGIGWYAGKVAAEMARGDLKLGRTDRFTPEQLLDRVGEYGEAVTAERWREFADATVGRQMTTWSPRLHGALGSGPVLEDAEVAAAEVGGEVVALLRPAAWWAIHFAGRAASVLEAAEEGPSALDLALSDLPRDSYTTF